MNQLQLQQLKQLSQRAGEAIMAVYHQAEGIEITAKADNSPLTQADLAAHQIINQGLPQILSGVPILSEEGNIPSYKERQNWQRYWLVDPLDGTKEFIQRNGEFTVNIALIDQGRPVAGVVYIPAQASGYCALISDQQTLAEKWGAQGSQAIQCRPLSGRGSREQAIEVVGSRRHGAKALEELCNKLQSQLGQVQLKSMGSSLKLCLIAEGLADLYPRLAPTCEWDTAAAHAIVNAAGGEVYGPDFKPLRYNQKDELLNPDFYVVADTRVDWPSLIQ